MHLPSTRKLNPGRRTEHHPGELTASTAHPGRRKAISDPALLSGVAVVEGGTEVALATGIDDAALTVPDELLLVALLLTTLLPVLLAVSPQVVVEVGVAVSPLTGAVPFYTACPGRELTTCRVSCSCVSLEQKTEKRRPI